VDDITVVYDVENSCVEQDTELIPCPICRKTFATKDIEVTSAYIYKCSSINKMPSCVNPVFSIREGECHSVNHK